jgi:hypothetical protein
MVSAGAQTPTAGGGRTIILFIDDLHLEFQSTPWTRRLMERLLRTTARDGDLVGIVSTGSSSISLRPTSDRSVLEATIGKVTGATRSQLEAVRHRNAEISLSTLVSVAGAVRTVAGPVIVVLVSDGYPVELPPDTMEPVLAGLRGAVTIYAVSPQVLGDTPPDAVAQASLRTLSRETGGMAALNQDDLNAVESRLAARTPN